MNKYFRFASTVSLGFLISVNSAFANPEKPTVVAGNASISVNGNSLNVTNSPGAIINWQEFSIAQDEITRFIQQNANSAVLNRVTGGQLSELLGSLESNGSVFLINPAGLVIGENAVIDTAGFVGSTLNLSDDAFQSDNYDFVGSGSAVVNRGNIHVTNSGNVMLLGSSVENSGLISTDNGDVLLAAGESISLSFGDLDHISFAVKASENQVVNIGQVIAGGGNAALHGGSILQRGGLQLVESPDGKILLSAAGKNEVSGELSAPSADIEILGDDIQLMGATISTSGADGGGQILVGGDYQGGNGVRTATTTLIDEASQLSADAIDNGNGGRIIVWSDQQTNFGGNISALGGRNGGDGGFVETSSLGELLVSGDVSIHAENGDAGDWLLDPEDITIDDGMAASIENTLNEGGHVTVKTADEGSGEGNITVAASITKTEGDDASLTLDAHNDISVNAKISSESNKLDVTLKAGNRINVNAPISTNGGDLTKLIEASPYSDSEADEPNDDSTQALDDETTEQSDDQLDETAEQDQELSDEEAVSEPETVVDVGTETEADVDDATEGDADAENIDEETLASDQSDSLDGSTETVEGQDEQASVESEADTDVLGEDANQLVNEEADSVSSDSDGVDPTEQAGVPDEVVADADTDVEVEDVVEQVSDSVAVDTIQAQELVDGPAITINSVVTTSGGDIFIDAAETGTVLINDDVDSSNLNDGEIGGDITLLGENVGVFGEAEVDASGGQGGGTILLGGEQQGGGDTPTSEFVYIGEQASLSSNGGSEGDGGTIIVYAEDTTSVLGTISAQGGSNSGDGGFVETSGRRGFFLPNNPDVSATNGESGTWLIDPLDIRITNSDELINVTPSSPFSPNGLVAELDIFTLRDALETGDVIITTLGTGAGGLGDITWDANLSLSTEGSSIFVDLGALTLQSANDIFINGTIITDNDITLDAIGDITIGSIGSNSAARIVSLSTDGFFGSTADGGGISIQADNLTIFSDASAPTEIGNLAPTFPATILEDGNGILQINVENDFNVLTPNGGDVLITAAENIAEHSITVGGNFNLISDSTLSESRSEIYIDTRSDTNVLVTGDFNLQTISETAQAFVFFENFGEQLPSPLTYGTFQLEAGQDINIGATGSLSSSIFELFAIEESSISATGDINLVTSDGGYIELAHIWQREAEMSSFNVGAGNDVRIASEGGGFAILQSRTLDVEPSDFEFNIDAGHDIILDTVGDGSGSNTAEIELEGNGVLSLVAENDILINPGVTSVLPGLGTSANFSEAIIEVINNPDAGNRLELQAGRDVIVNGFDGDFGSATIANNGGGDLRIVSERNVVISAQSDTTDDGIDVRGPVLIGAEGGVEILAGQDIVLQDGNIPGSNVQLFSNDITLDNDSVVSPLVGDIVWDIDLQLDQELQLFDFSPVNLISDQNILIGGSLIVDGDINLQAAGLVQIGDAMGDRIAQVLTLDSDFSSATNTGGIIDIDAFDLRIFSARDANDRDISNLGNGAPQNSDFLDASPVSSRVDIDVLNDFEIINQTGGDAHVLFAETQTAHTIDVGRDFSLLVDSTVPAGDLDIVFQLEGDAIINVGRDFIARTISDSTPSQSADIFIEVLGDQQPSPQSNFFFNLDVGRDVLLDAIGLRSAIVLESINVGDVVIDAQSNIALTGTDGGFSEIVHSWQRNDASSSLTLNAGQDLRLIGGDNAFVIIDPQNLSGELANFSVEINTGNDLVLAAENLGESSADIELFFAGGGSFDVNVGNDLLINPNSLALSDALLDPPREPTDGSFVGIFRASGTNDASNAINIDVVGNVLVNGFDGSSDSVFFTNEAGGDLNLNAGGDISFLGGNNVAGAVTVSADGTLNFIAGGDFTVAGGNVVGSDVILTSNSLNTINVDAANIFIESSLSQGQLNVLDGAPGSVVNLISAGLCTNCVIEGPFAGPGVVVETLNVTAPTPAPPPVIPPVVPPVIPPVVPPVVVEQPPLVEDPIIEEPTPMVEPPIVMDPPVVVPEMPNEDPIPVLPDDVINDVLATSSNTSGDTESSTSTVVGSDSEEDEEEAASLQCR